MFEAKLADGSILKKIVEAIKDVVNDVNIDVSPSGKSPLLPLLAPTRDESASKIFARLFVGNLILRAF